VVAGEHRGPLGYHLWWAGLDAELIVEGMRVACGEEIPEGLWLLGRALLLASLLVAGTKGRTA
jgi:hypothetical protein